LTERKENFMDLLIRKLTNRMATVYLDLDIEEKSLLAEKYKTNVLRMGER
jgi:hypothetical protein